MNPEYKIDFYRSNDQWLSDEEIKTEFKRRFPSVLVLADDHTPGEAILKVCYQSEIPYRGNTEQLFLTLWAYGKEETQEHYEDDIHLLLYQFADYFGCYWEMWEEGTYHLTSNIPFSKNNSS